MSARKPLRRRSSRQSIQSQLSGILNPDSNVGIDDDAAEPLWFKDFENNSVNIRPSARFSLAQNDTPILESDSEPETAPLQKSWWKNLDETSHTRASRPNVSAEKSNVQERSSLETSEASSLEEGVAKQRFPLRHKKRRTLQKDVFGEILDAAKDPGGSERSGRNTQMEEKEDTVNSPSDTDISIERVKKQLMFKKKKRTKLAKKSSTVASKSDESLSDVFQDALNTSPLVESHREATPTNERGISLGDQEASRPSSSNSGENLRLELEALPSEKRMTGSDVSENNSLRGEDSERSRSPLIPASPKKRNIFTKTTKRRTANFDELLNNVSEESSADQQSIRGELELNRSERRGESIAQPSPQLASPSNVLVQEDESDLEESIVKQRVPFRRKKRQSEPEKMFAQLLETPDTSGRSEPVSARKQTRKSELSRQEISSSDVERRSLKRKSDLAEASSRSNAELEENQAATPTRQSSIRSRSGSARQSMNNRNDSTDISRSSSFEVDENEPVRIQTRLSSVGKKPGSERRSINKRTSDRGPGSGPFIVELEENRSVSLPIRSPSVRNKSATERRSKNREKDNIEASTPLNAEVEEDRRSIVFRKPRDLNQDENSSNQSWVNKTRSSSQRKETSRGDYRKSMRTESPASTDEEEDEEDVSRNFGDVPSSSDVIDQTRENRDPSIDSRPKLRDASADNNTNISSPLELPNENADRRKTASITKARSMVQNLEKTVAPLKETNQIMIRQSNRSHTAISTEYSEIHESQITGDEGMAQSVRNRTERSFSSIDHNGTRSIQQTNTTSPVRSQTPIEKLSQIKGALEKIKGKEFTLMKTTTIDSYFKKTLATKPAVAVDKDSQKLPSKTKPPVVKRNKTVSANKAYLINGTVYKRPKLPRPKQWVTDRLYNFLWKKMEAKYKLRTRIRSEKFVVELSQVIALVIRRKLYSNYKEELENLIREMARLGLIKTRNDFNIFCQEFLPYDFRIKVIPMLLPGNVRNVPFNPDKLHTPILEL